MQRGCNFDPDGGVVGAPQSEQVVGDSAVAGQLREKGVARLRVDKTIGRKRVHRRRRCRRVVAEHQLQMRVCASGATITLQRTEIDTGSDGTEQPAKLGRLGSGARRRHARL